MIWTTKNKLSTTKPQTYIEKLHSPGDLWPREENGRVRDYPSYFQGRIQPLERGGPNCWPMTGVPGGWPPGGGPGGRAPWRGLQGCRAPLRREILNFWTQFARFGAYFLPTSYWKSLDLFPIKVFFCFCFFLFNYEIGVYKNGSFIVFTLVPPRVPQGVLLRPIYYLLQVRFRKQIMQYTGAARGLNCEGQSKSGGPGGRAPWWGSGGKAPCS